MINRNHIYVRIAGREICSECGTERHEIRFAGYLKYYYTKHEKMTGHIPDCYNRRKQLKKLF